MNIFYLHPNPNKAAAYHYDKHKVKMILEAAQMLCTAHHHYAELYEYDAGYIPYRKAHYNHPSTKWARRNMQHYFWLYDYMMALGEEYTKRYNLLETMVRLTNAFLILPIRMNIHTYTKLTFP